MTKADKYWALIIILLVAIIAISSLIVWSGYSSRQTIEISTPSGPELHGEIYIGGAVTNPGFYPVKAEDSLQDIIQAAGGATNGADLSSLKVYIPQMEEGIQMQKIDLNRAEAWLLEALPGIDGVEAIGKTP